MAVDVFARTLALASLGNGGGGSAVDTYTKAEIDKMFGEAGTVQVEPVSVLPTEDIKENVIYLVPNGSTGENYYNECMYINGKWEVIGTTEIDLSAYATKEELEEALADKVTVDALAAYATKEELIALNEYVDTKTETYILIDDGTNSNQYGSTDVKDGFSLAKNMETLRKIFASCMAGRYPTIQLLSKHSGVGVSSNPTLYTLDYHFQNRDPIYYVGGKFSIRPSSNGQGMTTTVYDYYISFQYDTRYDTISLSTYNELENYLIHDTSSILTKDNQTAFTPSASYNPVHKKYVDDAIKAIDIPSIEGLATEEYVNNQIATVSGNGINSYDIKTRLYTSLDGEPVGTQITDAEDIAVLETIINNQVPNTEIFLINNTEARNESTYLATMIYKEQNYCEINISSTLLWLGSVTGNLQIDYEEVDGQLKITNAIAGVYEFGYEISSNFYNKGEVAEQLETKQNVLTAGEGISIVDNVISATSSGESSVAVFEGTQEEYDALSDEEKAKYTIVIIDDGEEV